MPISLQISTFCDKSVLKELVGEVNAGEGNHNGIFLRLNYSACSQIPFLNFLFAHF